MNRLATIILRIHFSHPYLRVFAWATCGCVTALLGMVLIFNSTALLTNPIGWERLFVVSPPQITVRNYASVAKGRLVAIIIEGDRFGDQGIFVQISTDGGEVFSEPVAVSLKTMPPGDIAKAPKSPSIAISSKGYIFVTWQEFDEPSSNFIVYGARSNDFGVRWSDPERIELGGTDMGFIPHVAFDDSNRLHIFYHAYSNGVFNLFHVYRDDGGQFGKPEAIAHVAPDLKGSFFPTIVTSGDYVFVAWQSKNVTGDRMVDDIYFIRSRNRGSSFSSPERITNGRSSSSSPQLFFFNGSLFCVYENNEKKNWEIRFTQSGSLGERWDPVSLTVSSTNTNCYSPWMAATDSDNLVFFWFDNREGINRIYTRRYGLTDNRFSKEVSLSEGKDAARHPFSSVVGKKIIVLWQQAGRIRGKFSDIAVDTPRVYSKSHPEGKWVKNSEAIISWDPPKDESGIAGYASLLTADPGTNPTVQNLAAGTRFETIRSIGDGIVYYHIRAIDGAGNYSRTVHYPIRISRTPLPMPVIESKTHPEGKSVINDSPKFNWQISDIERVKGFLYKLSKDYPGRPDTFTEKMSLTMSGLSEGRYFLRVQGVDRTNTLGRSVDYEFIVGKAEAIDPDKLKRYGADEYLGEYGEKQIVVRPVFPAIAFTDYPRTVMDDYYSLHITSRTPSGYRLDRLSYELYRGGRPVDKGLTGGTDISLKGLTRGDYLLRVRGVFTHLRKKQFETGFIEARFSVRPAIPESPLVQLAQSLSESVAGKALPLVLFFPLLMIAFFIAASGRFAFYFREYFERGYSLIRVIVSSFQSNE
jgi:hypothetical protein